MKVLLIDDDHSTNFFHKIILEEYGKAKEYTFFQDALEAIEYLNRINTQNPEKYPDIIFLDLNMPKVDGWEFLEKFKEHQLPHCHIIILSTSMSPSDIKKAEGHPLVHHYISKPLFEELLVSLEAIV